MVHKIPYFEYELVGAIQEEFFVDKDTGLDFSSYGNSMWWVILTMTTVGYGDFYPVTVAGRVIGFICCINGICSIALMVTSSILFLKLNPSEEKSYAVLQRIEFKQ